MLCCNLLCHCSASPAEPRDVVPPAKSDSNKASTMADSSSRTTTLAAATTPQIDAQFAAKIL